MGKWMSKTRFALRSSEGSSQLNWALDRLQIETCWQRGLTGAGVRIGHLDTGVDSKHPMLCDRIATFAQFDPWGDRVPNAQPWDSGNHGTHTAGLLCGEAMPSAHGNVSGIAPQAKLCSGMVIEGGHPLVRVLAGLDWLLDQQIRVLCLSLGVPGYNPLFEIVLARLRQQGVLTVCPIGNQGRRIACSPANYPGVLAVGAINDQDQVPGFSGSGVAIVAPGVHLLSAQPDGNFASQTGTSMAAAIVAGVAALLFQAKPTATVEEVEQALLTSCTPLPHLPPQRVGHGLINPIAAVEYLLNGKECDRAPFPISEIPHRVDPRLLRQLDAANSEDLIAAIALVSGNREPILQRLHRPPIQLKWIPSANAIALMATPDVLYALLDEPEVYFLSSTTIDPFYLG